MSVRVCRQGLAATALLLAVEGVHAAPRPDVYILAGQSNMSGRGLIEELTEADRKADPLIRLYGNDGRERPALDPLDDATGQIDAVSIDRQAAVGPGLFFARQMLRRHGRPILLVPCAKGASAITRWNSDPSRDRLFGSCLARMREVRGRLAGFLWYQGETDAERPADEVVEWPGRFATMIADFRRGWHAPRLPVLFVQLGDRPARVGDAARWPSWPQIQSLQAGVRLRCAMMVPAAGLPRKADDLHLTTEAQRRLGERLASGMDALERQGCR